MIDKYIDLSDLNNKVLNYIFDTIMVSFISNNTIRIGFLVSANF